jgi:virginiamycin A acetyltransferase
MLWRRADRSGALLVKPRWRPEELTMPLPHGPDPHDPYPLPAHPRTAFLKNHITRPNIIVGDYTYYDDPDGVENFERNVLYHFDFIADKLIIGKFCALGTATRFIMNGANHNIAGFSTYPFPIFEGWRDLLPADYAFPARGDTVVGNDVWIGYDCLIMPGVKIGDGAIIATRSLVTKDVPPYTIVGGHPARVIRPRFDDATIAALLEIRWWDWDAVKIARNLAAVCGTDIQRLRTSS